MLARCAWNGRLAHKFRAPVKEPYLSAEDRVRWLNEGYWQFEARRAASDVGAPLGKGYRDEKGPPGSFYTSHAEAQLMSFLVRRNRLFRDDKTDQSGLKDDFLQLFVS